MTFGEIYTKYNIMPILQDHMIRVAYVGKTISNHTTVPTETNNIIKACLLHDMGNIIKFNLEVVPEAVEPEGLAYWQNIQNTFVAKYGNDEVVATHTICQELTIPNDVMELVNAFGTRNVIALTQSNDLNKMIVNYADHRVSPYGIEPLKDRIADQQNRIATSLEPDKATAKLAARKESDDAKFTLEKMLFEKTDFGAEDIANVSVDTIREEFLAIEI
ncbi:hypothetical protein KC573_03825 [candidate division WWE3 bacterium]|uniref:HD domain-containing protein n=1 Tax=candidate division WWE3 bacterium TaxID=2053526 RepID=A0A955LWI0_UNCKA|nr:hypothetical protein [candidate division WWE3 bacterium]